MKNTIKKMIKAIAGICALAAVFAMSDNTGGTALAMSVVQAWQAASTSSTSH